MQLPGACLIAFLAFTAPAAADTGRDRFAAATARLASGDTAGAVSDLIVLADDEPDHELAADALFTAAGLRDDRLADPAGALVLYRRILRDHPDTRVAAAAARRVARLGGEVGPRGESADRAAAFARLRTDLGQRPEAEILAEAAPLADADWPGAPRVALWIADVHRRAGRAAEALRRYGAIAARWPDSEHQILAWRGAATAALDIGDADTAEASARRLPVATDFDRLVQTQLLDGAAILRRQRRALLAACIALAAAAAGLLASLLRARPTRAVFAPPIEVAYMLPVAAALTGAAWLLDATLAPAVGLLCGGGAAITWLSGAGLAAAAAHGEASTRRRVIHVALCVVAAVALLVIAVVGGDLLDRLRETMRYGPDR